MLVALLKSEQRGLLNLTRRGKPCAEANDGDLESRNKADQISSDLDTSSGRKSGGDRALRLPSGHSAAFEGKRETRRTPFSG